MTTSRAVNPELNNVLPNKPSVPHSPAPEKMSNVPLRRGDSICYFYFDHSERLFIKVLEILTTYLFKPTPRVIKLLNPLEKLIQSWAVSKIGQVGEEVPYNPKQHQLLSAEVQRAGALCGLSKRRETLILRESGTYRLATIVRISFKRIF
ncbi:MAG: hypothetical protein ACOCZG_02165 [Halothece sp.]